MPSVYRKAIAWCSLCLCIVLTVVPPALRPVTGLPHDAEHFLMFFTIGVAFSNAYPGREHTLYATAVLFSGLLEFGQLFVPGRHARLSDFLVDLAAAMVGVRGFQIWQRARACP